MKTYINPILILLAVAALVVATFEYKRLLIAEKTNDDAADAVLKRNAAMKARIDSLKLSFPQLAHADTDGAGIDARATARHAAEVKADKERRAKSQADYKAQQKKQAERMRDDPDFALKHYASLRAKAEIKHVPFCRAQNLSQEQSDALAEAEFQWSLRMDDLQTAKALGESGVDEKALRKAASDEFAASVKAALGDDLYGQFQVYKRQDAAWDFVKYYGGGMSLCDMPLDAGQAARLVDAIANACPSFQKGKNVIMLSVDWNAVDAAAADILTPEQMDYFKNAGPHTPTDQPLWNGTSSRQMWEMHAAIDKLIR